MNYKEARVYLDEMSKYGSVLGLDSIRNLLRELHNPQEDLRFVHIAGTNGKGSVLAYTSTVLSEAGIKTGRYISPTVVSYLERIQIDGENIAQEVFAHLTQEVKEAVTRMVIKGEVSPTVFELESAIAFLYFKQENCDIVVLETGLGGALDATNIITNTLVAAFTSISRDHMGFLGDSLQEITQTKAGIIKQGCSVVTTAQKEEVLHILMQAAEVYSCPLYVTQLEQVEMIQATYEGQRFVYRDMPQMEIHLAGHHQMENALTAIEIIEALRQKGFTISEDALVRGLQKTVWKGRFTCIADNPLFIIDGAHNEDAARCLADTIKSYLRGRRLIFIIGVFKDKEYNKILSITAPLASVVYTISLPDTQRTLSAEALKDAAKVYCAHVYAVKSIEEAVVQAQREAQKEDVIVAFGSLSYLGRVMELVE